jgi:hypothetical protein
MAVVDWWRGAGGLEQRSAWCRRAAAARGVGLSDVGARCVRAAGGGRRMQQLSVGGLVGIGGKFS